MRIAVMYTYYNLSSIFLFLLKAIERMKTEFQAEKAKHTEGLSEAETLNVEFMQVDLSSLCSVKSFIDAFKSSGRQLHTLICNAGIAIHPQRK